jgi:hypothetical protein
MPVPATGTSGTMISGSTMGAIFEPANAEVEKHPLWVGGGRHLDPLQPGETEAGVVGRIAHQHHPLPTGRLGTIQALADQEPREPLALTGRMNRYRTQEQRGQLPHANRPVPDRGDQRAALVAQPQTKLGHRRNAVPQPVRRQRLAARREAEVVERFDLPPVRVTLLPQFHAAPGSVQTRP